MASTLSSSESKKLRFAEPDEVAGGEEARAKSSEPSPATDAPKPKKEGKDASPSKPTTEEEDDEEDKPRIQPKSALKLGGSLSLSSSAKMIHCAECNKDIPAEEWPNHRDRLRAVHLKEKSKTFVQRYILAPILSTIIWALVNVFFREVAVVGADNVPKKGPVIFYGNHQNQFIDAMMMRAFCGRNVRFIIAEKSMTRPVIGQFARLMDAVPVVRPQDVPSLPGSGKLVASSGTKLTGQGTAFSGTVRQGDVILWSAPGRSERCSGQVLHVHCDTEVELTRPVADDSQITSAVNWKLSKRIDHSEMYADVYETLKNGGAIGIFPEGGSHDHTSLIPLKAGVALFTLGAAERGLQVNIVPVGLTYFFGHKFRSRAHIEFGKPQFPPIDLVEQFTTDKRTATGELLKVLDRNLRSVTINVADWATLKFLHNFRRMYQPPGLLLETGAYLGLTRRLAVIAEDHAGDAELQEFRDRVENYSDFCNALFVRDSQAATLSTLVDSSGNVAVSIRLLLRRIAMLCVLTSVLLPFFVVCGPIGLLCHILAEAHAKTALSASSVKVVAADVKASYKMVAGFVLSPLVFLAISVFVGCAADARTGLTVLCSMPVVMYVSVVLVREWVMELFATLPLVISIVAKHKQFLKLHERRCTLVEQAKSIVAKFDPELDEQLRKYTEASAGHKAARQASLFSLRHQSRRLATKAKKVL